MMPSGNTMASSSSPFHLKGPSLAKKDATSTASSFPPLLGSLLLERLAFPTKSSAVYIFPPPKFREGNRCAPPPPARILQVSPGGTNLGSPPLLYTKEGSVKDFLFPVFQVHTRIRYYLKVRYNYNCFTLTSISPSFYCHWAVLFFSLLATNSNCSNFLHVFFGCLTVTVCACGIALPHCDFLQKGFYCCFTLNDSCKTDSLSCFYPKK